MPPLLLLMALRMVADAFAPRNTLFPFCAALLPWHSAQLAVYSALPAKAELDAVVVDALLVFAVVPVEAVLEVLLLLTVFSADSLCP